MRAAPDTAARNPAGADTDSTTTAPRQPFPRLSRTRSMPGLRRGADRDAAEAELAERIKRGDHRLVRRARIGAQQHVALVVLAGDLGDRALERIDIGAQHFAIAD